MNLDIKGLIRTLLSAVGAYLLGKNLFGLSVDESLWQEITGGAMGLISIAWSIKDKTATIEMIQGTLRQTGTYIGGLVAAYGFMSTADFLAIVGIISAITPFIYAGLSRKKTADLEKGKLSIGQLNK